MYVTCGCKRKEKNMNNFWKIVSIWPEMAIYNRFTAAKEQTGFYQTTAESEDDGSSGKASRRTSKHQWRCGFKDPWNEQQSAQSQWNPECPETSSCPGQAECRCDSAHEPHCHSYHWAGRATTTCATVLPQGRRLGRPTPSASRRHSSRFQYALKSGKTWLKHEHQLETVYL